MTRTRWIIVTALLAIVLVLVASSLLSTGIDVQTERVRQDTLRVQVVEEGTTRPAVRYMVSAPVSGRLERLEVEEGDMVEVDEVIARIQPAPLDARTLATVRAQVAAAEAREEAARIGVERAAEQVRFAEETARRTRALAQEEIVSPEALDRDEFQAQSARQQQALAEAGLRSAQADLAAVRTGLVGANPESGHAPIVVRAPGRGRILQRFELSERVIPAGTPLVEIGEENGLEVVIEVLSESAVAIKPGDPVFLSQWGGEGNLVGRVRLREPQAFTKVSALGVEEQRVRIVATLPDHPSGLGSGYRVEAAIQTWAGSVLRVPSSALFSLQGQWNVFVSQNGRAALRPVRLGRRARDAAEVLEGLREGEEVIVFPSADVLDGVKVH